MIDKNRNIIDKIKNNNIILNKQQNENLHKDIISIIKELFIDNETQIKQLSQINTKNIKIYFNKIKRTTKEIDNKNFNNNILKIASLKDCNEGEDCCCFYNRNNQTIVYLIQDKYTNEIIIISKNSLIFSHTIHPLLIMDIKTTFPKEIFSILMENKSDLNKIEQTIFYELNITENTAKPIIFYFEKGKKQILNLEAYKKNYDIQYSEDGIVFVNRKSKKKFLIYYNIKNKKLSFKSYGQNSEEQQEESSMNELIEIIKTKQNDSKDYGCFNNCTINLNSLWQKLKSLF